MMINVDKLLYEIEDLLNEEENMMDVGIKYCFDR
jgi:hypothetical protein